MTADAASGPVPIGPARGRLGGLPPVFVFPGAIATPTGGFRYDRRMVAELAAAGRPVDSLVIEGAWPFPSDDDVGRAEAAFAAIADGRCVIVDGLALGALPGLAQRHRARLALVALVHHPLWLETATAAEEAGQATVDPARARLRHDEATALSATRLVIVTSARTARAVSALGVPEARIAIVEPGCDPFPLARGSQAEVGDQHAGAPLRLICVATVTPRKGYRDLVDALARVERDRRGVGAGWTLDIIGSITRDPAHADEIRQQVAARGLAERIRFIGEVDEAALHAHYDQADGMVLASHYEGYGMSLVEALMHGLPLVVTRGGAIADTVGDGACVVAAGDPEALAGAIRQTLLDPHGRQALACQARRWRDRHLARQGWAGAAARFAQALDRAVDPGLPLTLDRS